MRSAAKYSELLGFYQPNMFHLHVHTKLNLKRWREWDDTTLCTFFHEYIHFLQDISTVSGLYNIYVIGERLQDAVVNHIYPNGSGAISVPINCANGTNNVNNNRILNNYYQGNSPDATNINFESLQVADKPISISHQIKVNGAFVDVSEIRVSCKGSAETFLLGSFQITESMAYLAEKIVYGANVMDPSPNYPYCTVEQIAHYYSDDLYNNKSLLFALCDLSLCYSHSGKVLLRFFDIYVNEGCPKDYRDFLVHLVSDAMVASNIPGVATYQQGVKSFANEAIQSLNHRFKGWNFADVRSWYTHVISTAIKWRIENPMFMLDLVEGGELKHNIVFQKFMDAIGTPLMSNDNNELYSKNGKCWLSHVSEKRMALLLAAGSIFYMLMGDSFCCELKVYCPLLGFKVSRQCEVEPWTKVKLFRPCPYGYLWYGWKLKDFRLVRK